ncbi:aa3-type cytochrome c oxidase subunit IV [Croceibacterium ferulae]|nr:aa3-type cytochrome c oxidase subunit IV [Croceibacterium ferulae]
MEPANDMEAAGSTYAGFIGTLKWSVPLIAVLVFIIVLAIS